MENGPYNGEGKRRIEGGKLFRWYFDILSVGIKKIEPFDKSNSEKKLDERFYLT